MPGFDVQKTVGYWIAESEEALRVADHLQKMGDHAYALFFGHLALEKILKALYVSRHGEHAPPIHNLLRLAKLTGLQADEAKAEALTRITAFSIDSRYPDMEGQFRSKCTPEFTAAQMRLIREHYVWVRSRLP